MDKVVIDHLKTESRNSRTINLDIMTTGELIKIMNEEDQKVIDGVNSALPQIEKCIKMVICALNNSGRLIYMGAGTSGRIGILDAVECAPTFSTIDEVIGIIAGGDKAFVKAVEGAEDSFELAGKDLNEIGINENDVVVAIAASGRTPYAIGALKRARKANAKCVSVTCNINSQLSKYADVAIEVDVGPEVLTGSTRLKAGTCQKIILNMISTASMVGIGKVYGNLMVDMKPTNLKLVERAKRVLIESTGCDEKTAVKMLEESDYNIKAAIVMILADVTKQEAEQRIKENNGFVRKCINI